jgi:hypothetical protein
MKCPLFPALGLLVAFVGTQSLFKEATVATPSTALATRSALSLATTTFEFPGAGEHNDNGTIGDFCCTGETAVVRTRQGIPVGYIYFHDFAGGITNGSRSAATKLGMLVSGTSDATRPESARVRSSIEFASRELKSGLSRRAIAGVLQFTGTILEVQFIDKAHSRYWMDSIRVRVDVQETSGVAANKCCQKNLTCPEFLLPRISWWKSERPDAKRV